MAQKHVDPMDPDPEHWLVGRSLRYQNLCVRSGSIPVSNFPAFGAILHIKNSPFLTKLLEQMNGQELEVTADETERDIGVMVADNLKPSAQGAKAVRTAQSVLG